MFCSFDLDSKFYKQNMQNKDGLQQSIGGSPDETEDRRDGSDRRRRPTPIISRYTFLGRRRHNRRSSSPQFNYYVDLYDTRLLVVLLLIVLLSLADSVLTYRYVSMGGHEANPVMKILLEVGDKAFFSYKFVMTAMGIFVLCLHKNFTFVRSMITLILILYVLIMFDHVGILLAF